MCAREVQKRESGCGPMVGRDLAADVIARALRALAMVGADGGEAVLLAQRDALTRFANSEIHQNADVDAATLNIKAVSGMREGTVDVSQFDDASLARAARIAYDIASVQPASDDWPGLAEPQQYEAGETFDEATAVADPQFRAGEVARAIALADRAGLNASGSLRTRVTEVAYGNSLGASAYARLTDASFKTVMLTDLGPDAGSGYAEQGACSVRDLDVDALAAQAVELGKSTVNPGTLEPGEYPVVLMHSAVATAVGLLAYAGVDGLSYLEGRSYASGRLGQKITGDLVTIVDDWRVPGMPAMPFDFEGMPRQAVSLIHEGVAAELLYSRRAAARAGRQSTGHDLYGGMARGGYPLHLCMMPGDSCVEEMIASIRRGVLVTRFNYTNIVHPVKAMFTGMTKDGTFLIEDGKVTRPLRNLRFTDSLFEGIFARAERLSRDTKLFGDDMFPSLCSAPALQTVLNFTGSTV